MAVLCMAMLSYSLNSSISLTLNSEVYFNGGSEELPMMPRQWHRATGNVEITADPRGEEGLIRGQKHKEDSQQELHCGHGSAQQLYVWHTLTDM